MHVDYIIIGQGLCGTLLSRSLITAGKKVLVIDEDRPYTSTKAASGVINPVTGRRIVKTWRIAELLPFARQVYTSFGKEINKQLVSECSIIDFFPGMQMKEAFENRVKEEMEYVQWPAPGEEHENVFNYHFGAGKISPCLLVDLHPMLNGWRQQLTAQHSLLSESFMWKFCTIKENEVRYKNITAEKVLCCEGVAGFDNPYFRNLPYSRMKGEVIIASIPGLPRQNVYKQGINIVPWKDNLFWIGSTYEWEFKDMEPTKAWRNKVEEHLSKWLKVPFNITDHFAAERPANLERRPFVGLHPHHPAVGIFNGMGAKGCSLAPFFAAQFTSHLLHHTPIYPEADVNRFQRVLLRELN